MGRRRPDKRNLFLNWQSFDIGGESLKTGSCFRGKRERTTEKSPFLRGGKGDVIRFSASRET
jgi:hypothetical protein